MVFEVEVPWKLRPRPDRLLLALACSLAIFSHGCFSAAAETSNQSTTVVTGKVQQVFRGWGASLAWDANLIFGSSLEDLHGLPAAGQQRFIDLLFSTPPRGLGLTVARYNVGGGDNPDRERCRDPTQRLVQPGARMEGFLDGPGMAYEWERDQSQRRMLREAARRGATIFQAFSNSAPWWMTRSKCASGAEKAGEDNLDPDMVPAFAAYLATVVHHLEVTEGIRFESVSPLNEPDGSWWVRGGRQEGSSASVPLQDAVLTAVALQMHGTGALVAGTEANSIDEMTRYLGVLDRAALAGLGRVNVHLYNGSRDRALREQARAIGKPVWMSEFGCCIEPVRGDVTGAFTMARSIERSLAEIGAESWSFWQATWGIVDLQHGQPAPLPQYRAIAAYTAAIRPGHEVLAVTGPRVATRAPDGTLSIVSINESLRSRKVQINLRAIAQPGSPVSIAEVRPERWSRVVPRSTNLTKAGEIRNHEAPRSITTYVVRSGRRSVDTSTAAR